MKYRIFESENSQQISQQYQVPSLIAKIIDQKGFQEEQLKILLNPRLIYHDYDLFSEADMTIDRIEEAIENEEKICIYGDYDCDGILATTILVQAFLRRGVQVGYHIPHRYEDGYGLNVKRVEQIVSKGYSLIITVDNGVKAFEAIERANELGVDVIITDHHEFDEDLPDACSVIHTKISPDYPFKAICGGFVAYKLAVALNGNKHDKYLFSLAAITTISDMMPLLDENRSLVKRGLEFMNQQKYTSLELLLGNTQKYDASTIGYTIVPKINSFGRLPEMIHPNALVKYFLKDAPRDYMIKIADAAQKINQQRQKMTNDQYQMALPNANAQYLYYADSNLHEGIVGLIASKYTREFEKPSFVMHYDEETGLYKGSARSVDGFSLYQFFMEHQEYLKIWGGHKLAGGFSLTKENYEKFKEIIDETLKDMTLESYQDVILIDSSDISLHAIESLKLLEPFGMANESPLFLLKNVPINKIYTLKNGKHLKIEIDYKHIKLNALFFHQGKMIDELKNEKVLDLVGQLSINEYRNIKSIQLIVKDIHPHL